MLFGYEFRGPDCTLTIRHRYFGQNDGPMMIRVKQNYCAGMPLASPRGDLECCRLVKADTELQSRKNDP
jgi:hypothetical protein